MKLKTIVGMGLLAFSAVTLAKELKYRYDTKRRHREEVTQIIAKANQEGYIMAGNLVEVLRGYKTAVAFGYRISETGEVFSPLGLKMGQLSDFSVEERYGVRVLTRESNLEFLQRFDRDEDCQAFIRSRL